MCVPGHFIVCVLGKDPSQAKYQPVRLKLCAFFSSSRSVSVTQVLDIVRTNVHSALQRIWREQDLESLHLYRLFNRVFNRLLWSHGQGLWNCFSNTG